MLQRSRMPPVDVDPRQALRATSERHRAPPLVRSLAANGLGPYRGYSEILDVIERFAERGGAFVPIGRSVKGEPLVALRFGSDAPDARTSVLVAGLHPIEWIGVEAAICTMDRLAGTDLGERATLVFPIANPDGYLRVEASLRAGKRRFYRHNARGVDLNRNFDVHWNERGILGWLLRFLSSAGSAPASEPEVASIAATLADRRVDRAVSLHSFGGAVLYPPGHAIWPSRDYEEQRAWATAVARRARHKPYRPIQCAWFSWGFTQGGLELDWFHERHGAVSLLVECEGGFGKLGPGLTWPFGWFNPADRARVANGVAEAVWPFLRGDSLTP